MSMSLSSDVPIAIQAFVDAANAGDPAALAQVFTEDALLADGDREFRGHEGVAEWGRSDVGGRPRFELLGVKPGLGDQQFVATALVSGDGFTGTDDLEFTLRGDRVSRLALQS
ncbi:nuclear transport factor 2 family protein [Amnibacterium kyonggiense]